MHQRTSLHVLATSLYQEGERHRRKPKANKCWVLSCAVLQVTGPLDLAPSTNGWARFSMPILIRGKLWALCRRTHAVWGSHLLVLLFVLLATFYGVIPCFLPRGCEMKYEAPLASSTMLQAWRPG